ncbi:MAG: hypothetical protein ACRDDX_05690 [Cellulosilyticaceae bacterium]
MLKKIITLSYLILIVITNIFYVPPSVVLMNPTNGQGTKIKTIFTQIWQIKDTSGEMLLRYELDFARIIHILLLLNILINTKA